VKKAKRQSINGYNKRTEKPSSRDNGKNANLRIMDAQVSINIYIIDSNKEELLIGSN